MRRALRALLGGGAAVVVLAVSAAPASALTDTRREITACMDALTRDSAPAPADHDDIGFHAVRRCLVAAGFHGEFRTPSAFEDPSVMETLSMQRGGNHPVAGDIASWRSRSDSAITEVGMFLDAVQVIAYDPANRRGFCVFPWQQLAATDLPRDGYDPTLRCTNEPLAADTSFVARRIMPSLFPNGADDPSVGSGRIAMVPAAEMSERMQWAMQHPADADTSLTHQLALLAGPVLAPLAAALSWLGTHLHSAADWLLAHPWIAPELLGLALLVKFGSLTFDATGAFTVLREIVLLPAQLFLLIAGWDRVRSLPVLGSLAAVYTRLMRGGAGLAVTLLTGLDDSGHTSVAQVVIALATLPFLVAKPVVLALRGATMLGALVERVGTLAPDWLLDGGRALLARGVEAGAPLRDAVAGGLERISRWTDVVALRPTTFAAAMRDGVGLVTRDALTESAPLSMRGFADTGIGLRSAGVDAGAPISEARTFATPVAVRWSRAAGGRLADLGSLVWRPESVSGDLLSHATDAARWVTDGVLRSRMPGWQRLQHLAARLPQVQHDLAFRLLNGVDRDLRPVLDAAVEEHRLQTGARTITNLLNGTMPPMPVTEPALPHLRNRCGTLGRHDSCEG